jgi:hypothetical protein
VRRNQAFKNKTKNKKTKKISESTFIPDVPGFLKQLSFLEGF